MATHSSVLAQRIPWTKEPGGLQSMGSQRVGHSWVTNTHTQCRGRLFSQVIVFRARFPFPSFSPPFSKSAQNVKEINAQSFLLTLNLKYVYSFCEKSILKGKKNSWAFLPRICSIDFTSIKTRLFYLWLDPRRQDSRKEWDKSPGIHSNWISCSVTHPNP